ncbi:MAG: NAD(P)H-dependent oxidoreductase subunit E [Candidatus Aminicenantes bacterium]|nr:NAD(P)H-dependent oxidoreductase subunit E [Candidatus Aminicenantes bacterium]
MTGTWDEAIAKRIEETASRYPRKESALLPALRIVQEAFGCVSAENEIRVGEILGVPAVRVREAVTFYSLFSRTPLGRHRIQVCRNLSCTLLGGVRVLDHLRRRLNLEPGRTSPDGLFSLETVECLGRCDESPCLMIDDRHHGFLTEDKIDQILASLE